VFNDTFVSKYDGHCPAKTVSCDPNAFFGRAMCAHRRNYVFFHIVQRGEKSIMYSSSVARFLKTPSILLVIFPVIRTTERNNNYIVIAQDIGTLIVILD